MTACENLLREFSGYIFILGISKEKEHLFGPEFADCALLQPSVLVQNAGLDVPKCERLRNLSKTKRANFL